jgi:hypothetical protein
MRVLACLGLVIMVSGAAMTGCDPGEEGLDDAAAGSGGSGGSGGTGGSGGRPPDARLPDTASATVYNWIAIFDDEKVGVCTGSGPGPDIDSVDLRRGGQNIGAGLRSSAIFSADRPGETVSACSMCNGMTCAHSGTQAQARAEGVPDAMFYTNMSDTGYISLNTGVLWIQIGQANGNNPAQEIRSGDTVIVREVDQVYKAEGGTAWTGCACAPEKYTVYAYVTRDVATTRVQLTPTSYRTENQTACGAVMNKLGCGTTDFTVP